VRDITLIGEICEDEGRRVRDRQGRSITQEQGYDHFH